ncbi:MAG: hypothetical protein HQK83_13985 [Fibrobacteria bacterium]|nr:hypothetical protein [Fibrobacteria bacterium]
MKKYFLIFFLLSIAFISWFSRHTVKTTLAKQILQKYKPDNGDHIVFLGSSLTDAGVNSVLLNSIIGNTPTNLQAFNLSLAEMSGDEYYYLIIKNWILKQGLPKAIILEIRSYPFPTKKSAFKLEGRGIATDLTLSELMDYTDYKHISGGFPGILNSFNFFLHKHSFLYHNRLHIQWKIRERLGRLLSPGKSKNPYGMADNAFETMQKNYSRTANSHLHIPRDIITPDRYLPDIINLSENYKFKLIFFRPPFPPGENISRESESYVKYQAQLQHLLDSLGIIYWDLSKPDNEIPWEYSDRIHLNQNSAARLTEILGDSLNTLFNKLKFDVQSD